ncbi:N/A [soil metagenome]|nr:Rrf2 family transcriptional regulator [Trueperaceae bacterium]
MATAPHPSPVRTLLKREESYAIHALLYVHEYPGASAAQIAADLQLPAAFTAKVLRRLAEAGYVESRKGRSGGVRLARALAELTLLDVIETMSGAVIIDTCQTRGRCATQVRTGSCSLNTIWFALSLQFREALAAVRLDALANDPHEVLPA